MSSRETSPDWFADESFWEEVYRFEFPEPVIDAGADQVETAVARSGVRGGNALDLGAAPAATRFRSPGAAFG
jgi:hypothetical protein